MAAIGNGALRGASRDTSRGASRQRTRIGWLLSGLTVLFLAMGDVGKLAVPELMIANSPPLGLPPAPEFHRLLGAILAGVTLLYAWPRTAPIGAVLLTGYLDGAVLAHLRVDSPMFSHTLFGVYLGALAWFGLWLRDARVRALVR